MLKKPFLFVLLIALMAGGGVSPAATIRVGDRHAVRSVSAGIAAAREGDTVLVDGGTYREGNLVVDKKIALIGRGMPVLDGEHRHEILSIRAAGVRVQGFWLKNSGSSSVNDIAALKVYNVDGVEVSGNTVENGFFGIYFQAARRGIVRGNTVRGAGNHELQTGNAIHAWKCDSLLIADNAIAGHRDGIYLEFVTRTTVQGNRAADNLRYGLHFMFAHDNAYRHNTFARNGAGVAVMYTKNVRMEHNVFEENWGDAAYGLLLKEISDSHIAHNTFARNTTAILMEGNNRVRIERNDFRDNGWALRIQASCMDNMIAQNNFAHNAFDVATNGSLVLNSFEGNYWDKYEGYDLDRDGTGDVPYRPLSLFSMLAERRPMVMLLFRSFVAALLDRSERVLPSLTPEGLRDDSPAMKPIRFPKHPVRKGEGT